MRRKHWWGATLGAGVVAGAVLMAPSALASPPSHSKAPTKHPVLHGKSVADNGRRDGRHEGDAHDKWDNRGKSRHNDPPKRHRGDDDGHHHHGYASGHQPCVTVRANKGRDGYNLHGKAQTGSTGYGNVAAGVYVSKDGGGWTKEGETTTREDGTFDWKLKAKGNFRVMAVVPSRYGNSAGRSAATRVGH
jgi:hypothetical protein